MADGEISAANSNAPVTDQPEKITKIRIHFWTQWNIASYFFVPKLRGVFSDFSLKEKAIWQMIAEDARRKNGYSPSTTNCDNRWKKLTSSSRKWVGSGRHFCYAMFTLTRTAHLDGRARNPNYSEHSVPTILIPELWMKKRDLKLWSHRAQQRWCSSFFFPQQANKRLRTRSASDNDDNDDNGDNDESGIVSILKCELISWCISLEFLSVELRASVFHIFLWQHFRLPIYIRDCATNEWTLCDS